MNYPHPLGCVVPKIRWDDYFSVCGTIYDTPEVPVGPCSRDRHTVSCGQIAPEDYPEHIRPLLPFHLFNADGPMHYLANSLFFVSDRDCWGLRKGEVRPVLQDGKPLWQLPHQPTVAGERPPPQEWEQMVHIGEGKEPELDLARRAACWPEAELADFTEENLKARLPALMREFVTVCREYLPAEVIARWS